MNIHVEYESATLVAMGLTTDPACDGVIFKHGAPDEVLASTNRGNPLSGGWLADLTAPGELIVSWSGTLADELFESHPMTWLRAGCESFATFCDDIAPQLEKSGKSICFQPHSRHVLSDPTSCLSFDNEREGPFSIALAPASMLEPGMMDDIEDHVRRAFEMLGSRCAMVILSDVAVEDDACNPVPLGQGELPREHILKLIADWVPPTTPIVVSGKDLAAQLEWLGG